MIHFRIKHWRILLNFGTKIQIMWFARFRQNSIFWTKTKLLTQCVPSCNHLNIPRHNWSRTVIKNKMMDEGNCVVKIKVKLRKEFAFCKTLKKTFTRRGQPNLINFYDISQHCWIVFYTTKCIITISSIIITSCILDLKITNPIPNFGKILAQTILVQWGLIS